MATRLEKLRARRTDPSELTAKGINEVYARIQQSEAVRYAIGAMQPVENVYTQNTIEQGGRIIEQLRNRLHQACDYRYQGSVTNNTHIKARSDLDLLTIITRWWSLEPPQRATDPYHGDPVQDLQLLRDDIITALKAAYPTATVKTTGSKSIPIEGGSLTRKIDVVPANWFDTNLYHQNKQEVYRGVQILDNSVPTRLRNTPFFHNALIEIKDGKTGGGMRKAARLMKSLKYDADLVDLDSYDIVSIAYNIDDSLLFVGPGQDLTIFGNCLVYCEKLQSDATYRNSIYVPDTHRKVFEPGHATVEGLNQLTAELAKLSVDILNENRRSFQKLAEARVIY